jgi:hypothetical protein
VWQQAGPPGAGDGLSAIAVDQDDPNVVYFAGASTVWVSDDGGETFNIVVQLGRALTRRTASSDSENQDTDWDDSEADENDPAPLDQGFDMSRNNDDALEEEDGPQDRRAKKEAIKALVKRNSITRLRILGDRVYVCGARGLVSFPRQTRTFTVPKTEWMGRKEMVLDVAPRQGGGLWIATRKGLHELEPGGGGRAVPGMLGQAVVTRLLSKDGLMAASDSGVWTASAQGFMRGAVLPRRRIIRDMIVSRGNLWALTKDQLFRFDAKTLNLREIITFYGGRRLSIGRQGKLWVAGDSGIWTLGDAGSLEPSRAGLGQALFRDIVSTREGPHPLWVVGRGGAWRLTTEVQRVLSERARRIDAVVKDIPTAYAVMEQIQRIHRVHSEQLNTWRSQMATAWLLPKVDLNYTPVRRRVEWLSFLPTLNSNVIDEVRILPLDDEFRVFAYWELSPPLYALLDRGEGGQDSGFNEELKRSYTETERLRRRTSPIYAAWLHALVKVRTSSPNNIRRALRERLELQRLSADLDALTGGHFSHFRKISQGEHL